MSQRVCFLWMIVAGLCSMGTVQAEDEDAHAQSVCPNSSVLELGSCIQQEKPKAKPVDPCLRLVERIEQSFEDEDSVRQEDLVVRRDTAAGAERKQRHSELTEMKIESIETLRHQLIEEAHNRRCKLPDLLTLKTNASRDPRRR
ncbi:MAG: hypothetical protein KGQ59_05575 [Bdellovibrionales bacterium]|nr:hypothetical protein [Bdellovibrionales bacterium]